MSLENEVVDMEQELLHNYSPSSAFMDKNGINNTTHENMLCTTMCDSRELVKRLFIV